MTSAPDLIVSFNAGREAERLALKYKAMRTNAFSFPRGTAHLFYDRLTSKAPLPPGPTAWICGDLHMENFGSFQGGNGLIVFDVNDFDEAACAPAAWDICRLATSILVAGPTIGQTPKDTTDAAKAAIESYFVALTTGKPLWLDDTTAEGPIGTLLHKVAKRDPSKLLDKRTVVKKGKRSLIVDGTKTLAIDDDDRVATQIVRRATSCPKGRSPLHLPRRGSPGCRLLEAWAFPVSCSSSPLMATTTTLASST